MCALEAVVASSHGVVLWLCLLWMWVEEALQDVGGGDLPPAELCSPRKGEIAEGTYLCSC